MSDLFDTHAHLDDEQLAVEVAGIVARAAAAGVTSILAVGTTAASSRNCLEYARQYPGVWSSAGIHPNHAAEARSGDWDEIVRLSQEERVVALGETGLDLYWKDTPLTVQQDFFDRHIRLSQETGKPLSGVMHSFTGTVGQAAEFLDLGLFISFAGMVTFKKSDDLRTVAASIPADRILVETDSPYLSPEPFRGKKPNEPARVVHTAECLAQVRGVSLAEFARQTTANARTLLRLV